MEGIMPDTLKTMDPLFMSVAGNVIVLMVLHILCVWFPALDESVENTRQALFVTCITLAAIALGRGSARTCPPCSKANENETGVDYAFIGFVVGVVVMASVYILDIYTDEPIFRADGAHAYKFPAKIFWTGTSVAMPLLAILLIRKSMARCAACT